MTNQTKYIHIRHCDYWWGVYGIGKFKENDVSGVEFSITNDPAGEDFFFHFDFYTLAENEFMEPDNLDYPYFLEKYHALKNGEIDYFISSLYYENYCPTLGDCELGGHSVFDMKSPSMPPYYAVVFLNEHQPLLPERIIQWLKKLSVELFTTNFEFELANIQSLEEAEKEYKMDGRF